MGRLAAPRPPTVGTRRRDAGLLVVAALLQAAGLIATRSPAVAAELAGRPPSPRTRRCGRGRGAGRPGARGRRGQLCGGAAGPSRCRRPRPAVDRIGGSGRGCRVRGGGPAASGCLRGCRDTRRGRDEYRRARRRPTGGALHLGLCPLSRLAVPERVRWTPPAGQNPHQHWRFRHFAHQLRQSRP